MLVVSRNRAVSTGASFARSTSTDSVWPGRPFFIRIGVTKASSAPASNSRSSAWS